MPSKPERLDNNITFIVCCPRSGSTWLRFLFNSHPEIACDNESFVFTTTAGIGNLFKAFNFEFGFKGLQRYVSEEDLIRYTREFISVIFSGYLRRKKKSILVEKSVDHALCISLIKKILPKSKFIHLIRDGRDVAISLVEASKNWKAAYPQDFKNAVQMWKRYNTEILNSLKSISNNDLYQLKYEDLLSNTNQELSRLYEFVGGSPLPISQIENIIDCNKFENLQQKYIDWHNGHFFRKGTQGQWKSNLSEKDLILAKHEIGDLLKLFEY